MYTITTSIKTQQMGRKWGQENVNSMALAKDKVNYAQQGSKNRGPGAGQNQSGPSNFTKLQSVMPVQNQICV